MAAKKRRCKYGRSKTTGKCKKAPKKPSSSKWTAARVRREEAMADRMYPGWRDYGEEGPSRSRPFGSLGRMRRSRRSRR